MKILILKNGCQNNISSPKNPGDVGYDLTAVKVIVKGEGYNHLLKKKVDAADFNDIKNIYWTRVDYIEYDTGVVIHYPLEQSLMYTAIQPNSRNSKMNLLLANSRGIIDSGYTGTIRFRYKYIFQPEDLRVSDFYVLGTINIEKIYLPNQVCGQASFHLPILPTISIVDELVDTERGSDGFGSTEAK